MMRIHFLVRARNFEARFEIGSAGAFLDQAHDGAADDNTVRGESDFPNVGGLGYAEADGEG